MFYDTMSIKLTNVLVFFSNLLFCLKFGSFTKMAVHFTLQDCAQIATHNKVWRSVVQVQRRWRIIKDVFFNGSPLINICHLCS